MRVGVFIGAFNPLSGGGNTLQGTIIKELGETKTDKYEFLFLYSGGRYGKREACVDGLIYYNIDREPSTIQKVLKRFWEFQNSLKACDYYKFDVIGKKFDIDIFWIVTPWEIDITYPYIYTVWDLGHRVTTYFPEMSLNREWDIREKNYNRMLPRASYILTGNETGKQEILDNYSVSSNKIRIAPFPISAFCFGEEKKPQFEIPEKYFFYPAQFWAHKNHICILKALLELKNKYSIEATVFFSGSDYGNKAYIQEKTKEYGLDKNVRFTGFLEESELKYIYTHATAMIYSSQLGPNNLPPIEATYLECPIIISDIPGHKEQLGESALFFDGTKPYELCEHMYKVWNDETYRNNMIVKERTLAEEYKKIRYVDAILDILDEYGNIREMWG